MYKYQLSDKFFDRLLDMFSKHQEYFKAIDIYTSNDDVSVMLTKLEELAETFSYGQQEILEECKRLKQKLWDDFFYTDLKN